MAVRIKSTPNTPTLLKMNQLLRLFLILATISLSLTLNAVAPSTPGTGFPSWTQRPPMGWNSYDSYHGSITEGQFRKIVDRLAERMAPLGWEYAVIDYLWFHPGTPGWDPNNNWRTFNLVQETGPDGKRTPRMCFDAFGRPIPPENRFPSAAGGKGFKPLADYVHSKGMKFGVHIMRGIPAQVVEDNLPILGSSQRARDIAEPDDKSSFLKGMWHGVNHAAPGAQAYYDSLFALFAEWGVDLVKADDMMVPPYHAKEIEMMRRAIDKCGRPIVLSLSYGEAPIARAEHLRSNANLWRISADFWDEWADLRHIFDLLNMWSPFIGDGRWPDADMLPVGELCLGDFPAGTAPRKQHKSSFTPEEQRAMISLWCIARSPLMWGGDPLTSDEDTYRLLTNPEILAVNQHSARNRQIVARPFSPPFNERVWIAEIPGSEDKYLGFFNLNDTPTTIDFTFSDDYLAHCQEVRDLWERKDLGLFYGSFSVRLAPHEGRLYRLSPRTPPAANTNVEKPNVLFIAIDDLKPILGSLSEEPGNFLASIYPDPKVRANIRKILSPNLDKLGTRGVQFRHAYCPAPLCNPSRTALLTGIRASQSAIYANKEFFRKSKLPHVADAITLPQNFRRQGYYTAGAGKIFHLPSAQTDDKGAIVNDWPDQAFSWDTWINAVGGREKGQTKLSPWSLPEGLFVFGTKTAETEAMDDWIKADLIARALEQGSVSVTDSQLNQQKHITLPQDKPFFLACGIFRPHLPWVVPSEYLDLFKAEDIQITREFYKAVVADLKDLPAEGLAWTETPLDDGDPGRGRFSDMLRQGLAKQPKDGDLVAWREAIRHYLASVAFADRCAGRLLDALERSRYRDNTLVVLWSDHGWELGTKFRMGKDSLWEESANCVLFIRDPSTPASVQGTPCDQPVGLQDLYPTLSKRAGLVIPDYVDGTDISGFLQQPRMASTAKILTTRGARNHALRGSQYRYIRYNDDSNSAELYDQQKDPTDLTNLIKDESYQSVRQEYERDLANTLSSGPFPYDKGTKQGKGNRNGQAQPGNKQGRAEE